MSRLDWKDAGAVEKWLEGLRASLADMDHVTRDMLRPHRKRLMGHAMHAANARAARAQLRSALAYAEGEPEHGDPAGLGGSPGE